MRGEAPRRTPQLRAALDGGLRSGVQSRHWRLPVPLDLARHAVRRRDIEVGRRRFGTVSGYSPPRALIGGACGVAV